MFRSGPYFSNSQKQCASCWCRFLMSMSGWLRPRYYLVYLCMFQECPPGIQFNNQSAVSSEYDTAHAQSSTRAPPPPRPERPDARHECEVCGRTFAVKRYLSHHLRNIHSTDGPRHECEVCGRKFARKSHLSKHLGTVHSADGPRFECGFAAGSLRE